MKRTPWIVGSVVAALLSTSAVSSASAAAPAERTEPRPVGSKSVKKGSAPAPKAGPAVAPRQVPARGSADQESTVRRRDRPVGAQGRDKADLMIVKFRSEVGPSAASAARSKHRLTTVRKVRSTGAEIVRVAQGTSAAATAVALRRERVVEYASPNQRWQAAGAPAATGPIRPAVVAADPLREQYWGLENTGQAVAGQSGTPDVDVQATQAWTRTKGDPDLVVAVIDEGVDLDHPDLDGNIWTNAAEAGGTPGADDDLNGYVDDLHGWDFYNDDATVFDAGDGDTHGTHVAGTIASELDNGLGGAGVAPNVKIMPLKFLGPGGGFTTDAILAIDYATTQGVRVSNNSWGGGGFDLALEDAIERSGQAFIAAAGNAGRDTDVDPHYPASYGLPNVLSVAALDNRGGLAPFSNFGRQSVDVGAPGVDVLSTQPRQREVTSALTIAGAAGSRTVLLGLGLEDVDTAAARRALMDRTLSALGATSTSPVLLVDDDASLGGSFSNAAPVYQAALSGRPVTTLELPVGQDGPTASEMNGKVVVWQTGDAFPLDGDSSTNLTASDQASLTTFLDGGGKLLLAGPDVLWNIEQSPFVQGTLHAHVLGEGAFPQSRMDGAAGSAFAGTSYGVTGADSSGASPYRDALAPADGSATKALLLPAATDYADAYAYFNGTSMATPHAAGVAALVASAHQSATAEQLVQAVAGSGTGLSSLTGTTRTGRLVRADRALDFDTDGDIPALAYPKAGQTVTDSVHAVDDHDDVRSIFLHAGETLTAVLDGPASGADLDLYLYDDQAQTVQTSTGLVAWSEGTGADESLTYRAARSGVHYLDVAAFSGSGAYVLTAGWGNGPGVYEDSSPAIRYGSAFSRVLPDAGHSGGTARATEAYDGTSSFTHDAYADLSFVGSGVRVTAFTGPDQGIAQVAVDGVAREVSLWSSTLLRRQVPLTIDGLDPGTHTLRIAWTGRSDNRAKRTATGINLDAVEVLSGPVPVPQGVVAQYRASSKDVLVSWQPGPAGAQDGYDVFRVKGTVLTKVNTAPVTGTSHADAAAAAAAPPGGGDVTYVVRAVLGGRASADSAPAAVFVPDTTAPGAPAGLAATVSGTTVTLTWAARTESDLAGYELLRSTTSGTGYGLLKTVTGTSTTDTGTAGTTYYYVLKAKDGTGNRSGNSNQATAALSAGAPTGAGTYEETDAVVVYTGTWNSHSNGGDSGGSVKFAPAGPASASMTFAGTQVRWVARKGPSSGINKVFIDGALVATIDRYNASNLFQQSVFTSQVLPQGNHTIRIEHTGTRNTSATDDNVMLDAFIVSAAPPAPGAGTYDETHPAITYGGSWTTSNHSSDSGGSVKFAPTGPASASMTFAGTQVRWVARKGLSSGINKVFIDGALVATIDRYNASNLFQQSVFTSQVLPQGNHTIRIEHTGTRNTSATDDNVMLDAFIIS